MLSPTNNSHMTDLPYEPAFTRSTTIPLSEIIRHGMAFAALTGLSHRHQTADVGQCHNQLNDNILQYGPRCHSKQPVL